jgi:hypothetical protein
VSCRGKGFPTLRRAEVLPGARRACLQVLRMGRAWSWAPRRSAQGAAAGMTPRQVPAMHAAFIPAHVGPMLQLVGSDGHTSAA